MGDDSKTSRPVAPTTMRSLGTGSQFVTELRAVADHTAIFRDFTAGEAAILAGYTQAYLAERGTQLFAEGQKGECLYLLLDGKIDIFKRDGEGELHKIHTVKEGKTLGEMSLFDGLPFSASAIAAEPTRVLVMLKVRFEKLAKEQPAVCLKLVRGLAWLMSLRLRQTTGVLLDHLD